MMDFIALGLSWQVFGLGAYLIWQAALCQEQSLLSSACVDLRGTGHLHCSYSSLLLSLSIQIKAQTR
ncbi:hypothetical protein QUF31_16560 [Dickeya chrysanthemi]|uniref:hypothetical protein n=1 Tax=Dickeya chrysanthemi TaxID=556 RepID=UPI0025A0FD3A|nr:hypothetical protein [Dickeya chrysanthemi]WJM84722.1 hypothetical protein QUF31_16560 [Dickeya chrysanthemi]